MMSPSPIMLEGEDEIGFSKESLSQFFSWFQWVHQIPQGDEEEEERRQTVPFILPFENNR